MKPTKTTAGQTAVSLVTLYRSWAAGHADEQPSLDEFMIAMGHDQPGVDVDNVHYLMDVNAALVAMVVALLEQDEHADDTLQLIARAYQEDA